MLGMMFYIDKPVNISLAAELHNNTFNVTVLKGVSAGTGPEIDQVHDSVAKVCSMSWCVLYAGASLL